MSRPLFGLGAVLVVWLLGPIVVFLAHAPGQLRQTAEQGLATPGLGGALVTSVVSATISTLLVALVGIPLARVLATARARWARVLTVLVQLPLALPPVMSGIVLIYLVGPYTWLGARFGGRLTDTLVGVVIAQSFVAAPFLVIAARGAFAAIDPDVGGLASSLGLSPAARFFRVDLPLAGPGVLAGALLTWLRALGEYGATSLLAYHPYTLPVYTAVQFDGGGLPGTVAPTLLALGLTVLVVAVVGVRWPRRHRRAALPPACPPAVVAPTRVVLDLHRQVGGFDLQVSHAASSHRLAIVGESGAGKSLTLKAIAGLLDAGTVRLVDADHDDDVTTLAPERRRLGWVPQSRVLFAHRSVWRNAVFAPRADHARAAWWLRRLGIAQLAEREPSGLSGGERQRVSLAQALAHDPRVLLLDEPFSALDTTTHHDLRLLLRQLQRECGLSSVLVTHDPLDAALLSDEVLVLAHGRVVQSGPTADVFARPASVAVARLLGVPNVLPATMTPSGLVLDGTTTPLAIDAAATGVSNPGARVLVRVPAASMRLVQHGTGWSTATVRDLIDTPTGRRLQLRLEGMEPGQFLELDADQCLASQIDGVQIDELQIDEQVGLDVDARQISWWTPVHPTPRSLS